MKGVTFIRAKLHPVAECQHAGCGWTFEGRSYVSAATVRSNAERHVAANDHIVTVTIRDITEYAAETRLPGRAAAAGGLAGETARARRAAS